LLAFVALNAVVRPLDRVRARLFRAWAAHPRSRRWLVRRDQRVAAKMIAGTVIALLLAVVVPVWTFALSPIALGIPHVAGDLRHLVLRRRLSRAVRVSVLVFCALLVGLAVVRVAGVKWHGHLTCELAIASTWVLVSTLLGARDGVDGRRLRWLLPVVLVASGAALAAPALARLVLAQLHNVVGIALWMLFFRKNHRPMRAPFVLLGVATLLLASGAMLPIAAWTGGTHLGSLSLTHAAALIAPGAAPSLAAGALSLFVFLQALHYQVWLNLLPEEEIRGEASHTYRMSARSLVEDLGGVTVLVIVAAMVVVAIFALGNLERTRNTYLELALFHGYLELALLAYFLARADRNLIERRA
jgi:hypothetical protein